jgi:hypothetical protein
LESKKEYNCGAAGNSVVVYFLLQARGTPIANNKPIAHDYLAEIMELKTTCTSSSDIVRWGRNGFNNSGCGACQVWIVVFDKGTERILWMVTEGILT